MHIHIDILKKLADRTISYFKNDLLINIDSSYDIIEVSKIDFLDVTTLISLSSDISGTIGMSVSNKLAFIMVENFIFGEMSKEELTELSSENIAETLNITLGNILPNIDIIKNGGEINISTPKIIQTPITIINKKDDKMYLCKIQSNNETIILSYTT